MYKYHYQTEIDGVPIEVTRKRIKNLNIRIYPLDGKVRVSAPYFYSQRDIHRILTNRIEWIKRKQSGILKTAPKSKKQIISGEHIPFLGKSYQLQVKAFNGKPSIHLMSNDAMVIHLPPDTAREQRIKILYTWYRKQLQEMLPPIITKWELVLDVDVAEWRIRRMKTRWGSCNTRKHRIWINLELVKLSPEYIDYVVLHEMVHLLEKGHNKRFYGFMDMYSPTWRNLRKELKNHSLEAEYWAFS